MKNKTLLWVGIGSALLIGGGLFWYFKNKQSTTSETKEEDKGLEKKSETTETEKSTEPKKSEPKAEAPKKSNLMFLKGVDNTTIYSYPEFKGQYVLGTIDKSWLLDKAFGKAISDTGTGWIKFETIAFVPQCPPNARCSNQPQAKKVTAYIKKEFVSDKPF